MRFRAILLSLFILSGVLLMSGCIYRPRHPNIILLQADDLGYSDLGVNGNNLIETPNIDQLAAESVSFSQFYVNPVCAPTRASLLTGRHFLRTGVEHVHGGKDFLNLNETTIAGVLKQNGYTTGMWGKWHSGHTEGYYPWQRGFDEAYMARLYQHEKSEGLLNGKHVQHDGWADEVIVDYAIDFIEKNKDEPFFAYLPFLTCHAPLIAPEEYVVKYIDNEVPGKLAILYGMIDHMDFHIKRLLDKVDELGLAKNTVILFMSDNGPAILNNDLDKETRALRNMNKLKGHKGNLWENGVKSPLFVRQTKKYKPRTVNYLVDITDIFPFIVDVTRSKLSEDNLPIDGASFRGLLRGRKPNYQKFSFNYANKGWPPSHRPWSPAGVNDEYRPVPPDMKDTLNAKNKIISIRSQQFKLTQNPGKIRRGISPFKGYVLVDILNDPREEYNLYIERPDVVDILKPKLLDWYNEVKDDPGSYKMPEFQIGKDDAPVSEILAKGPVQISNDLLNTAFYLTNWDTTGQNAIYKINVHKAGTYYPELDVRSNHEPKLKFALHFEDTRLEAETNKDYNVLFDGVNLSEGQQYVKIELLNIPKEELFIPLNIKLYKIVLKRER